MNSETLRMVDPDVLRAVKTVTDENVPSGKVAVQLDDGTVKHMDVDAWQAQMRANMAKLAEAERQVKVAADRRRASHKRERDNRRRGRGG